MYPQTRKSEEEQKNISEIGVTPKPSEVTYFQAHKWNNFDRTGEARKFMKKPSFGDNPFAEMDPPNYNQNSSLIGAHKNETSPPSWLPNGLNPPPSVPGNGNQPPVEMDPNVPRMIMYTRVINLVLAILMILASLLSLLTTNDATSGVLACYVVVFSCLLCCFEAHLKQISKFIALNFGFMYSAKSRSFFMFFIGTIMFSFSLFGKIIGLMMLANSGFNIYVLFKYPQYEEAQRKDATSEISDFLSAHPSFAQKFAAMGVQAIASNPDIARSAADAYFRPQTPSTAPTTPSHTPPASPSISQPPSGYSPPSTNSSQAQHPYTSVSV